MLDNLKESMTKKMMVGQEEGRANSKNDELMIINVMVKGRIEEEALKTIIADELVDVKVDNIDNEFDNGILNGADNDMAINGKVRRVLLM